MLIILSCFALALLVLPAAAPGRSNAGPGIPPVSRASAWAVDTGVANDSALVPLTPDLITRYLAVRKAVSAFLAAHRDVLAAVPKQQYPFTQIDSRGMTQGTAAINLPDMATLAAKEPQVAALFKLHNFAPAQFAPVTIAIRKALYAAAVRRKTGWPIKNPQSVASKNIMLVEAHHQEFAGSRLDY